MKKLIKAITAIAVVGILAVGASYEITAEALIIAGACLAWLGLVGYATYRTEKQDER